MAANSRFVIAVHILCLLGLFDPRRLSSRQIANSLLANPVQVRRLLPALAGAGWVDNRRGAGGGYQLRVAPEAIRLDAVRHAIDARSPFAPHPTPPNPRCPVGAHVMDGLAPALAEADAALDRALASRTVADVLRTIRESGHPALSHILNGKS